MTRRSSRAVLGAALLAAAGVVVSAGAPASASSLISGSEGAAFSGPIGALTPGCRVTSASASIGWGDGNSSAGSVTVSGATVTLAGTHTYAEEGAFSGSVSGTYSCATIAAAPALPFSLPFSAQVADAPLQAGAVSFAPKAGVRFSGRLASFSDGNPAAQASDFRVEVDWGDGQLVAGSVQAA